MSEVLEQDTMQNTEENAQEDFRMVTFSLGRKAYGIDIMQVKEISSAKRFTYVPNTSDYMRGVFNLRGDIIPVIDMRLFFHLEITGEKSELDVTRNNEIYEDLIILTFGYINIGIIVDSISHVIGINQSMIQRSHPLFSELDVPYIDGIVDYKDQLYIILAMDRIIDPHLDLSEIAGFDLETTFANIATKIQSENTMRIKPEEIERSIDPITTIETRSSSEQQKALEAPSITPNIPNIPSEPKLAEQALTEEELVAKPLPEKAGISEGVEGSGILEHALQKEGFMVSALNVNIVQEKWREWCHSKNINVPDEVILDSVHNRKEFLELLQSKDRNRYWSNELHLSIKRHFSEWSGNLNVWHVGCGTGQETYALAASLVGAAPEANLQVRAADSDLLEVSEAPLQNVGSPSELPQWIRPYLNEARGTGGYTFAKSLKDRIIFEYQDILHSSPEVKADLIVIRDILSQYPEEEQGYILKNISATLDEGGLLVTGDYEDLDNDEWTLVEREPLRIYRRKGENG